MKDSRQIDRGGGSEIPHSWLACSLAALTVSGTALAAATIRPHIPET